MVVWPGLFNYIHLLATCRSYNTARSVKISLKKRESGEENLKESNFLMIRPPKTMGYKLITSSGLMHGIGSAKTWVYARCSFNRRVGSLAFSSNSKGKT